MFQFFEEFVMKMKILLLLLLLLAPVKIVLPQEIPECCCSPEYWIEDNSFLYNYDRIVLDTCGINFYSSKCDSSYWLNYDNNVFSRLYAKNYWDIKFEVEAIPIQAYDDTTIWVSWEDIDTSYIDIRNKFQELEYNFGAYRLQKTYPNISSEYDLGRSFMLFFIDSNYHHIKSVTQFIDTILYTKCWFGKYFNHSGKTDILVENDKQEITISPNPASEYIEIDLGAKLSESWELSESYQIQIFDVFGRQMYNFVGAHCNEPLRIDIPNFPDGVYFLKLSGSSELSESYQIQKFVVIK
jgi:hypothetical protein